MKIIVIGCSTAGMTAASKIKRTLQDKVEIVGYQKLSYPSLGACGLPYYVAGNFNDSEQMIARTVDQFAESGITVHTNHEVLRVDVDAKRVEIKNLTTNKIFFDTYDKLIITSGASPRMLPIPGINGNQVYPLYTIEDADLIKAQAKSGNHAVVVGAGFIGLEVLEALSHLGMVVSLVESGQWISERVYDADIAQLIHNELETHQINVHLQSTVKNIVVNHNNDVQGVELTDGTFIPAQLVVMATGVQPNTAFLKDTPIQLANNKAIIINNKCETNIPDVYAAGDCAMGQSQLTGNLFYSALATSASKQGKVIGNIISGKNDVFGGVLGTSIIKVFDGEIARTGMTEAQAQAEHIRFKTVMLNSKDYTNYVPGAKPIYVKVIYDPERDILLGAQIYGCNKAVLRIDAFVAMIWSRSKIHECGDMDLPYSPPFAKSIDIMNLILFKLSDK